MKRRDAFGVITMGAMGVAVSSEGVAMAQQPTSSAPGSAPPGSTGVTGQHAVKPLPFVPKSLRGLSERLIVSHHDNNYAGAVKNLNKVEEELSRVTADTPGFIVGGLKERELTFTNSMILHELYFGNLGGDGRAGGLIQNELATTCGTFGRWEEMFRATGMSLSGGSGWTIVDLNFHTGDLRTYWAGNHTQALASGCPLLVMDMYEHAYQMDFGAAAAKYVDAFFENIQWDEVNRRLERAQKAAAVLHA